MKFVCPLFRVPLDQYQDVARASEQAGFAALALSDRVAQPSTIGSLFPYTPDGSRPWAEEDEFPDVWVASAMMAAVTERIRLLQAVYVLPARDPYSTAKSLATLDRMTGSRISLGFGVGWMREEFAMTGQAFERRGARAEEMIALMRKLWTGESIEHHGEFYESSGVRIGLALEEPIPILCSGESEAALSRAARIGDGWIPPMSLSTPGLLDAKLKTIHRIRNEHGLDSSNYEVYWTPGDALDAAQLPELEALGVTHVFAPPWHFEEAATLTIEQRVERIELFGRDVIAEAGD